MLSAPQSHGQLPGGQCPPLRGLLRVPLCGPDRLLWDNEIRKAGVSSGSAAPVRDSEMQSFTFDVVRVGICGPPTTAIAGRRFQTSFGERPLIGADRSLARKRASDAYGSWAGLHQLNLDAEDLPVDLACRTADDRVRLGRPSAVAHGRQLQGSLKFRCFIFRARRCSSDQAPLAYFGLPARAWP